MNQIVQFVIVLGLFLVIDLPVILYLNKSMYQAQFARINKQDSMSESVNQTQPRVWLSGMFAYLLLALGIYWFVVRPETESVNQTNQVDYLNIALKGGLLGLVVYGVYNGTNMATINEWGTKEFFADTIWGTFLSSSIGLVSVYLINKFK
jgi:uncharacterized membrane protein